MPLDDEPLILSYISKALEVRDNGLEPDLAEVCEDRPDLVQRVAQALELAHHLPRLHGDSPGHDTFLGMTLGDRYFLEARLGAGSMGVVYLGRDRELERTVAIKVLRAEILSAEEARGRFQREAEVLAAIRHPSVVTIYDRGQFGEHAFLVMELLEGLPMDQLLAEGAQRRGGSPPVDNEVIEELLGTAATRESSYLRNAVRWTADLADGLSSVHQAGIYHRDIKPSNVFVRLDGRPALIDFGIATREDHATLLMGQAALGTPAYMAPEALDSDTPPGPLLDVYGLTATLYHMLTLRAPYVGTPSRVFSDLALRDPLPAFRVRKDLPRDLQAILDRGMARRVQDRYPTAGALAEDLRAFLDHRPVRARPVSPTGRLWRRLRRSTGFRATATVLMVIALVGAGLLAYETHQERRRERHSELWGRLLPAITLWTPSSRAVADEEEHDRILSLLDDLVDLRGAPVAAPLLRAGFHLDQGRAHAAARDMQRLAQELGTPLARELAERYGVLPAGARGAFELNLGDLPEPRSAMDVFLVAYHTLRTARTASDRDAALEGLQHPELAAYLPAQEILLQLSVGLANSQSGIQRLTAFRDLHERVVRLEESLGYRTAVTAHVMGGALIGQERYEEAKEPIRQGIALAPRAHGLRANLGIAARRTGAFEEAEQHLRAAITIRPGTLQPYLTLTHVLIHMDRHDEADAVVSSAPFGSGGERSRLQLEGEIEYGRVLTHLRRGERLEAKEAAMRTIDKLEQAGAADEAGVEWVVSWAVVEDQMDRAFVPLAELLREDPLNWARLLTLVQLFPRELSPDQTEAVRSLLNALALHVAPHISRSSAPSSQATQSPR